MKFKQFINEAAVGEKPTYNEHELDDAVDIFFDHCKDSMWMIRDDIPLARGDRNIDKDKPAYTADPTLTVRRSENTGNYYTVLIDNLPNWSAYPKRSKSFVCSTDQNISSYYGKLHFVIPYDGVKIGVCPGGDIWNTKLFGGPLKLSSFSDFCQTLGLKDPLLSWEDFCNYGEKLKTGNYLDVQIADDLEWLCNFTHEQYQQLNADLVGFFDKELNAKKLKFSLVDSKTLYAKTNDATHEVWIGGKCLIIDFKHWKAFRAAVLERAK